MPESLEADIALISSIINLCQTWINFVNILPKMPKMLD